MSERLILIDGSSYLYRAFNALPALYNSHNEPTGAVYGVLNMIRKLKVEYKLDYIAIIFDPSGETTRHTWYPAYKANRSTMPDALKAQIKPLLATIEAMGLPLIQIAGIEADDIMATLARQAAQQAIEVLIFTGDKDLTQLVNSKIRLINTQNGSVLNTQGVLEKFGVLPEQMIDYLALVGDPIDNIPGVINVGPKTAVKWLSIYGSLDNIIQNSATITGKIGDNLRNSLSSLALSKKLVTLDSYIDLPYKLDDLKPTLPDQNILRTLLKRLEFKNWLKELELPEPADVTMPSLLVKQQIILTKTQFLQYLPKIQSASLIAFDIQTTGLNTVDAKVIGIAIATQLEEAVYIPVAHCYNNAPLQLSSTWLLAQLKPVLEDGHTLKVGENIKHSYGILTNYGIDMAGFLDTMLISYVLNSSLNRHNLAYLTGKYLEKTGIRRADITNKGALEFSQLSIETAATYTTQTVIFLLELYAILLPLIAADTALEQLLLTVELPLVPVLSRMERHGVCVAASLLTQQSQELETRLIELQNQAYQLVGKVFNLYSTKQLQTIFYTQLKFPILEKTPSGAPATGERVLQELAVDYPLAKIILEHRSLSKLKSTYTDSLPKQIHPKTGRIHTSYNQTVTITGRLSSTDPNLQNIPIRHAQGRRIRQAFIAAKGYKLVSADYSQIELRIMAHLSQDENLLHAFNNQLDIHTATAADIFEIPLEQVTIEQRRHAKAINFGLMYGMSAFGLAKQLNIDRNAAQSYINQYFMRYPSVKTYMETARGVAHQEGYVKTLMGRRFYITNIHSSQAVLRNAAERTAINAPLQGTAADMIKLAMIAIDKALRSQQLDAAMIMQVHDELIFEVAEKDVDLLIPLVCDRMTHILTLSVPIEVHIKIGDNWDSTNP